MPTDTASEYEVQAQKFLDDFGIRFSAKPSGATCPPWEKDEKEPRHIHGLRYSVELCGQTEHGLRRLTFPFWNSYQDKQNGKSPTAYDVLACISSDVYCPETFEEFCSEYGYDQDSRKAEKTFLHCSAFAKKLREFFTKAELSRLQEIS